MMYFEDLSYYSYESLVPISRIRNVGWLSKKCDFHRGDLPGEVKNKIVRLVEDSDLREGVVFNQSRGLHFCELCAKPEMSADELFFGVASSSAEILIPDVTRENSYFAAPALIAHYVSNHEYLPPSEFVNSVLAFRPESQVGAQEIFDRVCSEST